MTTPTTYTNITLTAVEQAEAAEWLAENGFRAGVSPLIDDICVVYERVLADFDGDDDDALNALLKLAEDMSYELGCAALLVIVDEDAALIYSLFADGDLIDTYGVRPGQAPEGGDAELLADVFGTPKRTIKAIRATLKRDIASATERHRALVAALNMPPLAVAADYNSLAAGTLPAGLPDANSLVWVEADEDDSNSSESSEDA